MGIEVGLAHEGASGIGVGWGLTDFGVNQLGQRKVKRTGCGYGGIRTYAGTARFWKGGNIQIASYEIASWVKAIEGQALEKQEQYSRIVCMQE